MTKQLRGPVGTVILVAWLIIACIFIIFPVVYGVYSLIRGPIVDWYPYPFLDPRGSGYVPLAIGLVVLVVAFLLIALAVDRVGELATSRRSGISASRGLV